MRTLIRDADYLVTIDKKRKVFRNGAIVIDDDRIVDIGLASVVLDKQNIASFDKIIDASGMLVMPGFINTHVHTCEHLSRGLKPDTVTTTEGVMNWLLPYYASETADDEYVSAVLACLDMLKTGTTCFLDAGVRHVESLVRAVEKTGIRAVVGRLAMDMKPSAVPSGWPKEWADTLFFDDAAQAAQEIESVIQKWNGAADGRVRAWVTLIGLTTCSDELYIRTKKIADAHRVGVAYHSSSYPEEVKAVEERTGLPPIQHLERLGVLGPNVLLTHMVVLGDKEIEILKKNDVKICQCIGTGMKLAKGITARAKFPELHKMGLTLTLGCDGTSAFGSFDMIRQAYLAALMYKDMRIDPTLLPAEEAIEMMTINGARALSWQDEIGSLEIGKKADMILLDLTRIEWLPLNNLVRCLIFSASGDSVDTVIVDGHILIENRRFTSINEDAILNKASVASRQIMARAGLQSVSRWPVIEG